MTIDQDNLGELVGTFVSDLGATIAAAQTFSGTGYDLIATFDCLHDMGDPAGAARHIRQALDADGTWLIVEPLAGDTVADNLNPVGRGYYSFSAFVCVPNARSQPGGYTLRAQAGETAIRRLAERPGSPGSAGPPRPRSTPSTKPGPDRTHPASSQAVGCLAPPAGKRTATRRRQTTMTDIAELHARALEATGRIVRSVAADRWHAATPCPGWDARTLVNHLVSGNLWAAELAAGGTIESVGSRLDGDVLGPDPAGSYDASAKAAAEAFRRPGVLDAPCAVSYGPVPGSVYAGHRFFDVFIHGWDLAAATGQDTTLDAGLMQACRAVIEPQLEAFRGAGALAGPLPVPPGAGAQARFLAMLGRAG
jgi:uncharacterized protein (TIGR03086 family)